MKQLADINNLNDIKLLVDTFYEKVRKDNLIGPVFNFHVKDDWPQHLDKMYRFWQTILLGEETYFGTPFPPHTNLNINTAHLQRWLLLFTQTVKELFIGINANEIEWRATKITELFEMKLKEFNDQQNNSLQ